MSDSVGESKLSADGVDALQTTAGDILKMLANRRVFTSRPWPSR